MKHNLTRDHHPDHLATQQATQQAHQEAHPEVAHRRDPQEGHHPHHPCLPLVALVFLALGCLALKVGQNQNPGVMELK